MNVRQTLSLSSQFVAFGNDDDVVDVGVGMEVLRLNASHHFGFGIGSRGIESHESPLWCVGRKVLNAVAPHRGRNLCRWVAGLPDAPKSGVAVRLVEAQRHWFCALGRKTIRLFCHRQPPHVAEANVVQTGSIALCGGEVKVEFGRTNTL